jgi:hypothetical protein
VTSARRTITAPLAALLAVLIVILGFSIGHAIASSGGYTPPCTDTSASCTQARLGALESAVNSLSGGTPSSSPSVTPSVTPSTTTPPASVTAFGANPTTTTAAALAKWGNGLPSIRLFSSGTSWPTLIGVKVQVVSAKPNLASFAAGADDAATKAYFAQAFSSGIQLYPTLYHEIDSKVKNGVVTLAAWKPAMAHLVALAKPYPNVHPDVILTSWGITHNGPWQQYMVPGVKVVGADFDGQTAYPYPDWSKDLAALMQIKAAGYAVGAGEFGAPLSSKDTNGTARAAWMTKWGNAFKADGLLFVDLFDSTSWGYVTSGADQAAWQAFVG